MYNNKCSYKIQVILYFIYFNLIYNKKKTFLKKNILYLNCRENIGVEIRNIPIMTEIVTRVGVVGMALRSPPSGQSAVVAARRRRRFARHICCCRRWGSLAGVLF